MPAETGDDQAVATSPARPGLPALRVGQGFDLHPFSDDPERRIVLGGVEFPGERGLAGQSDAAAVTTS